MNPSFELGERVLITPDENLLRRHDSSVTLYSSIDPSEISKSIYCGEKGRVVALNPDTNTVDVMFIDGVTHTFPSAVMSRLPLGGTSASLPLSSSSGNGHILASPTTHPTLPASGTTITTNRASPSFHATLPIARNSPHELSGGPCTAGTHIVSPKCAVHSHVVDGGPEQILPPDIDEKENGGMEWQSTFEENRSSIPHDVVNADATSDSTTYVAPFRTSSSGCLSYSSTRGNDVWVDRENIPHQQDVENAGSPKAISAPTPLRTSACGADNSLDREPRSCPVEHRNSNVEVHQPSPTHSQRIPTLRTILQTCPGFQYHRKHPFTGPSCIPRLVGSSTEEGGGPSDALRRDPFNGMPPKPAADIRHPPSLATRSKESPQGTSASTPKGMPHAHTFSSLKGSALKGTGAPVKPSRSPSAPRPRPAKRREETALVVRTPKGSSSSSYSEHRQNAGTVHTSPHVKTKPALPSLSSRPRVVRLFENGVYGDVHSDRVPFKSVTIRSTFKTLSSLMILLTRELEWNTQHRTVDRVFRFGSEGGKQDRVPQDVLDVNTIQDGDILIATGGEQVIHHPPTSVLAKLLLESHSVERELSSPRIAPSSSARYAASSSPGVHRAKHSIQHSPSHSGAALRAAAPAAVGPPSSDAMMNSSTSKRQGTVSSQNTKPDYGGHRKQKGSSTTKKQQSDGCTNAERIQQLMKEIAELEGNLTDHDRSNEQIDLPLTTKFSFPG